MINDKKEGEEDGGQKGRKEGSYRRGLIIRRKEKKIGGRKDCREHPGLYTPRTPPLKHYVQVKSEVIDDIPTYLHLFKPVLSRNYF